MKKLVILLLIILMPFTLVACGSKTESATTDPASETAQSSSEVTIEGNKVVITANDGFGTVTLTEYIFEAGVLSEIVITTKCKDTTTAANVYEELMEVAEADTYSNIELSGKNVICTMDQEIVDAYGSISQEDLATLLRQTY